MRIIFCGTPDFAAQHLQGIVKQGHYPVAVFTQPDRESGRGQKLSFCPTKQVALDLAIPVYQPATLKDDATEILFQTLKADIVIVVAYGLIIPESILKIPPYGCINVHASLLPRWRGAAPIQRAIEAGDDETGVTIMQMDEGLDTGDMLQTYTCSISAQDTAKTLADKLIALGINGLGDVLALVEQNALVRHKQPVLGVTYAQKISKKETFINWEFSATQIERQIRAWQPHYVAKTLHHKEVLKIYQAEVKNTQSRQLPGTIINLDKEIEVQCGIGSVSIKTLQKPGGKPISSSEFLRGYSLTLGERLGQ
ncbi:MAG: methionyl-tRNA formyltransferase [Ferrovum sp. 37-45-19]|nr:MAG: methionyl-tRNA formyltransferase [Ferrovum sp. 37-45-19]HQT82241.1 methionyl-tRNA formyltransferase [Ferrovaceae bacterium]